MCELFAISSSIPTEVSFSLEEFSRHGGLSDDHKDGWGIAYYDQNDARIIKEAIPASNSAYLKFIKHSGIESTAIISHIRLASQGEISVRNTQPFSRELAGRRHVLAHNGDLNLENKSGFQFDRYQPIGNTDSEMAFCYLMQNMATIWNAKTPPDLEQRYAVVKQFAATIREAGIANFIYSDSDYIFIHSHKREDHHQPDKKLFLPGLYTLCRHCTPNAKGKDISGLKVNRSKEKKVMLVASVPLSDENWVMLDEGELRVLQGGKIVV